MVLSQKNSPKGEVDGVAAWEPMPGQYDIFWTFTREGADDERLVDIHIYPDKNPRPMYDEAKESSLKPDSWDQIVGWVDSPSGNPNRYDHDDIRMSGLEEKQPYHVRWVQQKQGDAGGYYVRLETSYQAPKDYLKDYADPLWNTAYKAGYFDPAL
jgi:hypothetical protein